MKPEFHEDYSNPEANDGRDHADFDWESLFERFGETTATDADELNRKLLVLLAWAVEPIKSKRTRLKRSIVLSKRIVAMAWVICPELFGANSSMTDVATSLGMHKAVLSEITSEFSRRHGVRNRYQTGHGWNHKSATTKGKTA